MDLRRIYATVGRIYLGLLLVFASSESHEKPDIISTSDDQLLVIKSESATVSSFVNSAYLAEAEVDGSGDSMLTTKQHGHDTDRFSTNQQNINSLHLTSTRQDGTSKFSSPKQSDRNPIPGFSRKSTFHEKNSSANILDKQHSYDANGSIMTMRGHPGYNSEPLIQKSTKQQQDLDGADADPSVRLSTRRHAFNDDPSTLESAKEKDSAAFKTDGESDPVTAMTTKSNVDTFNEKFTAKPSQTFHNSFDTTKSSTTNKKVQSNAPTFTTRGAPIPQNIHVMSSRETSLNLSLQTVLPGQQYMIKVTTDQIPNFSKTLYTTKKEYNIYPLVPGTFYKILVRTVMNNIQSEELRLENYTVPVAPQLIITRIEANSAQFIIKKNGTLCKNVHINKELRNHSKIYEDGDTCKMNLDKLLPGTRYSVTVWQTLDVWKSRSEKKGFVTKQKLPGPVQSFKMWNKTSTTALIFLSPPKEKDRDILGYLINTSSDRFCQTRIINCTGCKDLTNNLNFEIPGSCRKKICSKYSMDEVETLTKEFRIKNLSPFHNYKMTVMAYNEEGCGNETQETFTTLEGIPSPVQHLEITKVTNTSLEFRWKRPLFPNGNVIEYRMEYKKDGVHMNLIKTNKSAGVLERLHPYKMYTIDVFACTKIGCSNSSSVKNRTLVGIPMNVNNVMAKPISSTKVIVKWDRPKDEMGPTNYSVETLDNGIRYECQAEGFQAKECTVSGLNEYWWYLFKVTAYTSAGQSVPMESQNVSTLESTPGCVTDLNIKYKCFTKIYVKWKPPKPRDRNGIIHKYRVSLLQQNGPNQTRTVNEIHKYQELTVKPEHNFTVQVRAITKAGEGCIRERAISVPAGPPAIPEGNLFSPAPFLVKERSKQIAILLPMKFFSDNSNGTPTIWGLIVAQSEAVKGNSTMAQKDRNDFNLTSMRKWHQVHESGIIKPYRPTADDWKPLSFYGDDGNSHYILGADKDCGAEEYCNGYLQPGRSYRIKAFMCTRGGCSVTRYSGLFNTEKDMSPVYISTPILLIFAAISLAAIFLMWRKQLFCFRKHPIAVLTEVSSIHRTGETNKSFIMNLEPRSRVIRLDEFHEKLERMKKDSNLLFCEEFQLLRSCSPTKSHSAAELQANRPKNRYTNILAFDHSRVKLLPLDDEEGSDYINANYMAGYQSKREYIAAQGPLPGTKDDFWRMIWEQNVSVVVMVTQGVERGRIKCEIYWPTGTDPVYFGDLVVQLRSESNLSDYILRILDVQLGEQKREVKHFHFLKWPDFGCPANTSLLISFIQTVRSYMPYTMTGPTIIHCSAGVGRTGTFIAIDWLLQHIREHQEIDIFGLILEMRNYRVNMVQTEDQYIFIHQCIADHLIQLEGLVEEDVFINDTQM